MCVQHLPVSYVNNFNYASNGKAQKERDKLLMLVMMQMVMATVIVIMFLHCACKLCSIKYKYKVANLLYTVTIEDNSTLVQTSHDADLKASKPHLGIPEKRLTKAFVVGCTFFGVLA
jgi:hypothetical protein